MIVEANGKTLKVNLPPCYAKLSAEELLDMPVQIVQVIGGALVSNRYADIVVAASVVDLDKFWGPMRGKDYDTGSEALRFESREAYEILSN